MEDKNDFSELLAAARQGRGLTQGQLAKATRLYQSVISELESGKRKPTFSITKQLALVLKVPIQWFLTGSDYAGKELPDISVQLQTLGIVDLHVANERVPGAFRPNEEIIALSISGNAPSPRIVEAIPAVLAWNRWEPELLFAFGKVHDARTRIRLAWLADVALTIHAHQGFPGGCLFPNTLETYIRIVGDTPPEIEDTLEFSETNRAPPVARRWKIRYAAPLETFRVRAKHLLSLRANILTRALSVP